MDINLFLYLVAFLCFMAAALQVKSERINLQALGLALFVLTYFRF